jgi:hypothetical protein
MQADNERDKFNSILSLNHLVDSGFIANLPPAWLKVLLVFIRHANDDGVGWPTPTTIAKRIGMHPKTVSKVIRELVNAGLLETVAGHAGGGKHRQAWRRVTLPDKPEKYHRPSRNEVILEPLEAVVSTDTGTICAPVSDFYTGAHIGSSMEMILER